MFLWFPAMLQSLLISSTKCPSIPQDVCKGPDKGVFVHVTGSGIVHCGDTACSLLVHLYLLVYKYKEQCHS